MLGGLIWAGFLLVVGLVIICLLLSVGHYDPNPYSRLHPDTIAEVEAIIGGPLNDPDTGNPMLGTATTIAIEAASKEQVIAQVCASRQERGLPAYVQEAPLPPQPVQVPDGQRGLPGRHRTA